MKKTEKAVKPAEKKEKVTRVLRKVREAAAQKLITKKIYTVTEAAALLPQISISKFNGSCDLNVVLDLKAKQANETVRGSITFPVQFGEQKKILVLANADKTKAALEAGADYAGMDEYLKKIAENWLEFDVLIAQPAAMPQLSRLGKILGPRQLMPSPKNGTVSEDVAAAVKLYKAGKIDFKMDAGKTIKIKFGHCQMSAADLAANLQTAIDMVKNETRKLGPSAISRMYVKPTMGSKLQVQL